MYAPLVLFVYHRPQHTAQTLAALAQNEGIAQTYLYVYADGPKPDADTQTREKIAEVCRLCADFTAAKAVTLIAHPENRGLAQNVQAGITEVIQKYGQVIVLEDDLISSPHFLTYCNQGLRVYADSPNVYAINAYQFPLAISRFDTFLSPLATSSWGWATWADRWAAFDPSLAWREHIQSDPLLRDRFNFGGYDYATMLNNPKSWAIRWYYSVWLRNGLGLYPTQSLVQNIGFDGSGEHCQPDAAYQTEQMTQTITALTQQAAMHPSWVGEQMRYMHQHISERSWRSQMKEVFKKVQGK